MKNIEAAKERVRLEEYASRYVKFKKTGGYLVGLSPFKPERTPSFTVTPSKQIFKCFATGYGGDILEFIQLIHNTDFKGAYEILCREAGIPISEEADETTSASALPHLNKHAAEWFKSNLRQSPAAIEYVKLKRKITGQTAKVFELGYAPASDDFNWLQSWKREHATEAGLIRIIDDYPRPFFWNRLMFPIRSATGQYIAFAGRAMGDNHPKYLNTPTNAVYNKSGTLYGLWQNKDEIRKRNMAILVEGYMDVISLHQAGFQTAVACCGTAFTEQHARTLRQFTDTLEIMLDNDAAGQSATLKAIPIALKAGFSVSVIQTPWHDADVMVHEMDCIHTIIAPELHNYTHDAVEFVADSLTQNPDWQNPAQRPALIQELIQSLSVVTEASVRTEFIKRVCSAVGFQTDEALRADRKAQFFKTYQRPISEILPAVTGEFPLQELCLFDLCLTYPDVLTHVSKKTGADIFSAPMIREAFKQLVAYAIEYDDATAAAMMKEQHNEFAPVFMEIIAMKSARPDIVMRLDSMTRPDIKADKLISYLRVELLERKRAEATLKLHNEGDPDGHIELLILKIDTEIRRLKTE